MSGHSMYFGLRAIFVLIALAFVFSSPAAQASNVITDTVEKIDTASKTIHPA
jgi:hypothetical protein